jgi:NSS family neurotransmitter:Na+ symporter
MSALGQAFFSLSLGMGAMITYGSYLSKRESLFTAGVWVSLADTGIALLAGLAIFPALFTIQGLEPTEGPGLIFVVLPNIFDKIPGGVVFGTGFFVLLTIAALTSSISLLEVVVAYFIDEKGWSRRKAVTVFGTVAFLLGVPSALSSGAVSWLTTLPFAGGSFLDLMDKAFGNFSLAVGAMLLSLFVGWRWTMKAAISEARIGGMPAWAGSAWSFLIRFVCPVAIAIILIRLVISSFGQ